MSKEGRLQFDVNSTERLWMLRAELERLMHLAGYAAALEEHAMGVELTAIAVGELEKEGEELMSVATVLKETSEAVRTSAAAVRVAIEAAIARLSDNLSATDVQEIKDNLTAALGDLGPAEAAAATIDPNNTSGGVVVDPNDPGDVVDSGEEPVE